MSKTVEEALLQRILYIGNTIPLTMGMDNRPKFIVLGTPQELVDDIKGTEPKVEPSSIPTTTA